MESERRCATHDKPMVIMDGVAHCMFCWVDAQMDREAREGEHIRKAQAIIERVQHIRIHVDQEAI